MLRAGIAPRDADGADLAFYLRVMAQASKNDKRESSGERQRATDRKPSVKWRRGTIDQFWG